MKKYFLSLIPILFIHLIISGQIKKENTPEDIFRDAIFFYNKEDFREAAYLFQQLLKNDPDNANFNFYAGMSWLNIKNQETNSIPFLQKSVLLTDIKYKKRNFKERKAPHHAWFYLGNAYRINNQLDNALDSYERFQDIKDFDKNYNLGIVEKEVAACNRAKIIQDSPLNVRMENLGNPVNTVNAEYNAVLSADENSIVYVSGQKFYEAVLYSKKLNGFWSEPVNITSQLRSDGNLFPTFLSSDGKELYLVKKNSSGGDIYKSVLEGEFWTKAEALNKNINTRWNESHAALSPDGNTLIFTSNRKGGYGGLDIYLSKKQPDGDWGPPVNMGSTINSSADEDTPFFSPDGETLFFSSSGHFNMGGFDIFFSNRNSEGEWGNVINIGYPINTTGDDKFFFPLGNNKAYMSKYDESISVGLEDIIKIEILPLFTIPANNKTLFNHNFNLEIRDINTDEIIEIMYKHNSNEFTIETNKEGKRYSIQYLKK